MKYRRSGVAELAKRETGWRRKFDDPIRLPDGRVELHSLPVLFGRFRTQAPRVRRAWLLV